MKQALTALVLCVAMVIHAQKAGIGTLSNTNAKPDIAAADKGLLIPQMGFVHRKGIANTIGLVVYGSIPKSFRLNNSAARQCMFAPASGWPLTGWLT